jgi:hypothetical protein
MNLFGHMDMSFWTFNEFMNMFCNFVYENFVECFLFIKILLIIFFFFLVCCCCMIKIISLYQVSIVF